MKKSFVELSKRTEFIECSCDTCKKTFNYLVTKICLGCQINELEHEKTSIIRHSFLQTIKNNPQLLIQFFTDYGMYGLLILPILIYGALNFGVEIEILCASSFVLGQFSHIIIRFTKRLFGWSTYYD